MAGHGGRTGRRGAVTVAAPDPHAAMAAAGAGRGPDVFTPASTARVVFRSAGGLYLAPALVALSRTRPRSAQRVPAAAECRVQVRLAAESRASVRSWRHCAEQTSGAATAITASRCPGASVAGRWMRGQAGGCGRESRLGQMPGDQCRAPARVFEPGSVAAGDLAEHCRRDLGGPGARLRGRHVGVAGPRAEHDPGTDTAQVVISQHGLRTRAHTGQTARSPARGSPVRDSSRSSLRKLTCRAAGPGRWLPRHGGQAREHSLDLIDGNQPGTHDPGEALRGRHPPARSRPGGDRPVLCSGCPGCSDRHREASARSRPARPS